MAVEVFDTFCFLLKQEKKEEETFLADHCCRVNDWIIGRQCCTVLWLKTSHDITHRATWQVSVVYNRSAIQRDRSSVSGLKAKFKFDLCKCHAACRSASEHNTEPSPARVCRSQGDFTDVTFEMTQVCLLSAETTLVIIIYCSYEINDKQTGLLLLKISLRNFHCVSIVAPHVDKCGTTSCGEDLVWRKLLL